ncbi:hypothetical protein [Daejeonia sp. YH14]|uniref:hypothetical protein n=1 Tax=Daejeonia sp. YH14 TaxID=3439042 RepID=UPI003F49629C
MKHLVLLFLLLSLFSCRNEGDDLPVDECVGKWEWVSTTGITDNTYETPETTGTEKILFLNANSTYSVTWNGSVTNSGTYSISTKKDLFGGSEQKSLFSVMLRSASFLLYPTRN